MKKLSEDKNTLSLSSSRAMLLGSIEVKFSKILRLNGFFILDHCRGHLFNQKGLPARILFLVPSSNVFSFVQIYCSY